MPKRHYPSEKIIEFQNRLAQEMSSDFSPNSQAYEGHWGPHKQPGGIMIEKYDDNLYTVSVVDYQGTHISTHKLNKRGLNKLKTNNFWLRRFSHQLITIKNYDN